MSYYADLLRTFKRLSKAQRESLAYHAKAGTPIVCGRRGDEVYTDGKGGGCPAALTRRKFAENKETVSGGYGLFCPSLYAREAIKVLCQEGGGDGGSVYIEALIHSKPCVVRKAMANCVKE